MRSRPFATALFVALAFACPFATAEDPNLFRLKGVNLDRSSVRPAKQAGLAALTDGDLATVATAAASGAAPFEVVFALPGPVTPERLRVHLPATAPNGAALPAQVQVLVSTTSATRGFHLLRADPLDPGDKPQEFNLPPAAAKWVLLRFTPAAKASRVAIAELVLIGREGAPDSAYTFKPAPAEALKILARLQTLAPDSARVPEHEAAMLADGKSGQFKKLSIEEAALIADGVHDKAKRAAYLTKIDELAVQARKELAGSKTVFEKGQRLLKWLHAGPMAAGYRSDQSSLAYLLDTGVYNCVSSATLYNALARRFGMDARAVDIPGHVFSIVYDGKRQADVETTTADGFNPVRDPAAGVGEGRTYIPDSFRDQRREVGEAGLVALVYFNRGLGRAASGEYYGALVDYFRCMSLDAEFPLGGNVLAVLPGWARELADGGRFEDGLKVVGVGQELAPDDSRFRVDRRVLWSRWAEAEARRGKPDEALAVLARAAAATPEDAGEYQRLRASVFIDEAERLVGADKMDDALALAERGLKKLDGEAKQELQRWRDDLRQRMDEAKKADMADRG